MTNTAHSRNVKLGSIARRLGRINHFPAFINEAGIDNQLTDEMMVAGPYSAAEILFRKSGQKIPTIMFPIDFKNRKRGDLQ